MKNATFDAVINLELIVCRKKPKNNAIPTGNDSNISFLVAFLIFLKNINDKKIPPTKFLNPTR